ncbi:MAG TPA: class I SAM-dependent methyltransferase [Rhodanobacteraceae bacterium]
MSQYQSFPDACGDSRTLEKLKALRLPVLKDRSFLDVGCNEGFFCGFARFAGASRVMGLDRSSKFIDLARARFPDCEFRCQSWDSLPDERFDVILLASALHYADDQPALLHALVEHLAPDGVLVLELGLVPSQKSEWVNVTRGIDQRRFPSLMKLREILAPYASKSMGLSVPQIGDPVPRYVVHVSKRRPVACLLLQPPTWGKTTLAARLFASSGLKVISGDLQISRIAEGAVEAPRPLRDAAAEDFSRLSIDRAVRRIFECGQGAALVQTWLQEAAGADFALDGYLPAEYHDQVKQQLVEAGYMPVVLDWQRPGQALYDEVELPEKADAFFNAMSKHRVPLPPAKPAIAGMQGFVDRIKVDKGRLEVGGWARTDKDAPPDALAVRLKDSIVMIDTFERVSRRDVQERLGTTHDQFGFRLILEVADIREPADLGDEFSVTPVGGRPLPFTRTVAQLLGRMPSAR